MHVIDVTTDYRIVANVASALTRCERKHLIGSSPADTPNAP